MKLVRPVWAVVAAACAVVVAASVVGSVATGMGWWNWQSRSQVTIASGTTVTSRHQRWISIDCGGVYYGYQQDIPMLMGIPLVGAFFTVQSPAAWMPWVSINAARREVIVPFWTAGALALAGFVLAWKRVRRARPGECERCGYDLSGLPEGAICPECGAGTQAGALAEPPRSRGGAPGGS